MCADPVLEISVWLQAEAAKLHDILRYWFCLGGFIVTRCITERESKTFMPSIGLNKHLLVSSVNG